MYIDSKSTNFFNEWKKFNRRMILGKKFPFPDSSRPRNDRGLRGWNKIQRSPKLLKESVLKLNIALALALLSMPHPYMRFVGSYCRKYVHLWRSSVSITTFQIKEALSIIPTDCENEFRFSQFLTNFETPKNPNLYYINA